MSFTDKLPATYKSLKVQLKNTEREAGDLWDELGEGEAGFHECDCEYCPVPEMPDLTPQEREEKATEAEELDELATDYKVTIKRVEGYAKLVGVDLEADTK